MPEQNRYTAEQRRYLAERRRKRRARRRRQNLLLMLLIAAVVILTVLIAVHSCSPGTPEETTQSQSVPATTEPALTATQPPLTTEQPEATTAAEPETDPPAPAEDKSWKLILVNADHPLPEDYTVSLKELRNGHHVDERIYPELQQMFDDARAQGIHPLINESFRTRERQQEILDKYTASYEAAGMSHEDAYAKARQTVALPGTSEHELGLALDIIAEYDADSTATWNWLKENSWKYGFILRYPADKVERTGIDYEPWHFRYVGVEAAKEITEQGLCLEEYVEQTGP